MSEGIKCALTGHRILKEDFDRDLLERVIVNLIESRGVAVFFDGMAKGFDLEAAKIILSLKERYDVKLIACVPCRGQERAFSDRDKADYYDVLERCDEVKVLSPYYYSGCMYARDRYMVDNAHIVLAHLREASGGTYYTVNYARQSNKELFII